MAWEAGSVRAQAAPLHKEGRKGPAKVARIHATQDDIFLSPNHAISPANLCERERLYKSPGERAAS